MAKLYFKFGTMGSSKTANALMTKFNYEERGKKVWLIKPSIDTRDNVADSDGSIKTVIKSRVGLACIAEVIEPNDSILEAFTAKKECYDTIICDEAQFLSAAQIDELKEIVDTMDVSVFCFGLRTDFMTNLFTGSKRLFEIADSISEIKSICSCGNKATINARIDASGNVVTNGDQIDIGGNEKYTGMCYRCYKEKMRKDKSN